MWPLPPEKRTEVLLDYLWTVQRDISNSIHFSDADRKEAVILGWEQGDRKKWEDWDSACEKDVEQLRKLENDVLSHSEYVEPKIDEIRHTEVHHVDIWDLAYGIEQRHLQRVDALRPRRSPAKPK